MFFFKRRTPYRLQDGLMLEKSGILLAWDTPLEVLKNSASEKPTKDPRTVKLLWNDELVFGGVRADIEHDSYWPHRFFIRPKIERKLHTVEEAYAHLLRIVRSRLGRPHVSATLGGSANEKGYPIAKWQYGSVEVSLSIGESFYQYTALLVQRVPSTT